MTSLVLNFAVWSLAGFGLVLLLLQIAAREIGYWFGRRSAMRSEAAPEGVGVVVGSMLALLAFVLALTLSFANNRFSEREAGALAEANAIGTAWLQAGAIGHPRGDEIARLIKDYAAVRAAFVKASYDMPVIDELSSRSSALQNEMWGHLTAIVRERPDPVCKLADGVAQSGVRHEHGGGICLREAVTAHLVLALDRHGIIEHGGTWLSTWPPRHAATGDGGSAHSDVDASHRRHSRSCSFPHRRYSHQHSRLRLDAEGT